MIKVKRFISLTVFILKYVLSFMFLIFKIILMEFSIVFPYDKFEYKYEEYKNADDNRQRRFKTYIVICAVLAGLFWGGYFFGTSKHRIVTLDILFFFYLLIPFLFKKHTKYFPAVN